MSVLRNRLIARAAETFELDSEDSYRKAAAYVDEVIEATLMTGRAESIIFDLDSIANICDDIGDTFGSRAIRRIVKDAIAKMDIEQESDERATGMGDGEAAVPENEHITAINDVLERAWNPDNPAITTIREHVTALAESIADAEKQKLAYRSAMEEIEKTGRLWVPRHLRVYYNDVVCKIKRGAGVRGHE